MNAYKKDVRIRVYLQLEPLQFSFSYIYRADQANTQKVVMLILALKSLQSHISKLAFL